MTEPKTKTALFDSSCQSCPAMGRDSAWELFQPTSDSPPFPPPNHRCRMLGEEVEPQVQAATLELEEQAEIGGKGGRGNSFHFLKQVVSLLALEQLGRHGSLLKGGRFLCLLWRNFFMRLIPVWEDESLVLQSYKGVKRKSTLKSKCWQTNVFFNHKKGKK